MGMARSGPHARRPEIRLGLTVILGLLGTWLMPVHEGFVPRLATDAQSSMLLVWVAAACAGVLLLHRAECVNTPRHLLVSMGLALLLSWVPIPPAGQHALMDWPGLARMWAVGLLLLITGVRVFGATTRCETTRWWTRYLVHGPALAIAAPLLIFASRPPRSERPSTRSALFVLFLMAMATGSPLAQMISNHWRHEAWLICYSFGMWAWFGCALLFLLSPWPDEPRIPGQDAPPRIRRMEAWTPWALLAIAMIPLGFLSRNPYEYAVAFIVLIAPQYGLYGALLILLCPWPRHPRLPKLGELAMGSRVGPLATTLLLLLALIPFALYARPMMGWLFSGRLFATQVSITWISGWALDQSTVQSGFWRFTWFAFAALPHVAAVRWLSNRSTRTGYWAFAGPVIALFFVLFSYLTCVCYTLLACVLTLGVTPLRLYGLAYGAACYMILFIFLRWAIRPLTRDMKPNNQRPTVTAQKSETPALYPSPSTLHLLP